MSEIPLVSSTTEHGVIIETDIENSALLAEQQYVEPSTLFDRDMDGASFHPATVVNIRSKFWL